MQVTVNSGGVIFYVLFNTPKNDDLTPKEAAGVIKIASSRMATQSERLGYEFAKWLGVRTPQVIIYSPFYWLSLYSGKLQLFLDRWLYAGQGYS